jgi:SpoVK/Ycf46/Vps4 family AAA+-type ATPase
MGVLFMVKEQLENRLERFISTAEDREEWVDRKQKVRGESTEIQESLSLVKTVVPKMKSFDDIIGLQSAKKAFWEALILPFKFPHLLDGIESPMSILLYGPPGKH